MVSHEKDEEYPDDEDEEDPDDFEDIEEEFYKVEGLDFELIGDVGYLTYRDSLGRFASPNQSPERLKEIEADCKIRKFLREYKKKIQLGYNEKILLLRLVDDFRDRDKILDKHGFLNPKVNHFKRLPYHQVLMDHPMKRSAFSQFINRMVDKGLIRKIKHGKKLYLKITKDGLDRVYRFWEEYSGESWRMP